MQWTSHFFEVVIVASCNEYLSLPKKRKKEKEKHSITRKFAMVDMAQVFY